MTCICKPSFGAARLFQDLDGRRPAGPYPLDPKTLTLNPRMLWARTTWATSAARSWPAGAVTARWTAPRSTAATRPPASCSWASPRWACPITTLRCMRSTCVPTPFTSQSPFPPGRAVLATGCDTEVCGEPGAGGGAAVLALATLALASSLQAHSLWANPPTNRRCTWRMRLSLNMLCAVCGSGLLICAAGKPCGMGGAANLAGLNDLVCCVWFGGTGSLRAVEPARRGGGLRPGVAAPARHAGGPAQASGAPHRHAPRARLTLA